MQATIRDVTIRESLAIVRLDGFEPEKEYGIDEETGARVELDGPIDLPGDANWLCEQYGMAADLQAVTGILWADYEGGSDHPWAFAALVDGGEAADLEGFAREAGYAILGVETIAEPANFGDGNGTVEILKHRDGWVVMES